MRVSGEMSGVGKVEPEFIRRLLLLERCLKGTPDEYVKEDFRPHVQALRINLSGKENAYRLNLEECRERLEAGFAEIVPYAADGFPDTVRAMSTFLETFSESKGLVKNMDLALKRDKEMLDVNTGDVHALYYRSVRLNESINILDSIEYTMGVLKSVDSLLAENKTYQAVDLLVRGHKVATSKQLSRIQALEVIREQISERRETLFEEITEELIRIVYSGHPLTENGSESRASSHSHLEELVNSLHALKSEHELAAVIKKRIPIALEKLILLATAISTPDDRQLTPENESPAVQRSAQLTRFTSRDGATTIGLLEGLSTILPSAQAPVWSIQLCKAILDRSRSAFADTIENHSVLLTKVSIEAAKTLSLGELLLNMQQKLIELVNVLIGSVVMTAKDSFRKQLAKTGKQRFYTIDSSAIEFSFLTKQLASSEKLEPNASSIVDVVKAIPGLVPSRYNIPELRDSLLYTAQSYAKESSEASYLLALYANDLLKKELMAKLRADLSTYIDCLAGNVTSLINMEGTVVEDNASLPTLPAVLGVEKVIEEIVAVASLTGFSYFSHPAYFISQLGQFLAAFRTRCSIALTAAESWTAAGTLLTNTTFIGEMQSRMQMFFLQTAAMRRDSGEKRAPTMPDLEVDPQRDQEKHTALQTALDNMDPSQRITLSTVELKAVVRFISSLYVLFRKIDNPSSFGATADIDLATTHYTNLLEKGKHKQELQGTRTVRVRVKVTQKLLQAQTAEAGRLLEVADKGVMLLRIDMQAKVYLHLLDFFHLLCANPIPKQADAEQLGMQLGMQLVDFERVVKFNLDVTKREYMFNDFDSVFAMFLQQIHTKLAQSNRTGVIHPNQAAALRHFVAGTQKRYELLNERSSDSATLRALAEINHAHRTKTKPSPTM